MLQIRAELLCLVAGLEMLAGGVDSGKHWDGKDICPNKLPIQARSSSVLEKLQVEQKKVKDMRGTFSFALKEEWGRARVRLSPRLR